MAYAVGIDLGTTRSCVAVCKDGIVEIIRNEENNTVTPSFVFYGEENIFVGEEAMRRSEIKPENGIFDIKRIIGRKFDDPYIKENINEKKWPFKVINTDQNEPKIELEQEESKRLLRPEEICAEILQKLKEDAEKTIQEKIKNVVITVPAYFTNPQKQATEDAAKIAGLNVLKLIPEPTAAALAFFEKKNQKKTSRNILVYDLGGGTFDVSLVKLNGNKGKVLTIDGDSNLGGRDFDNNLMEYFIHKINDIYKYKIVEQKPKTQRVAFRRIRNQCEQIKLKLSLMSEAKLELDAFDNNDIFIKITRKEFEEFNELLFEKTIKIVDNILKRKKIEKTQIDDVILVGGSTRIPKIQQKVQDYFDGKSLNRSVNPDEAVAIGAALHASTYLSVPNTQVCTMTDITPFSIGVEIADGGDGRTMSVIIEKDTHIPATGVKIYKTFRNKQTEVDLRIFEGESKDVEQNTFLGELKIFGITPKKAGKVEIIVSLYINGNGILHVTAKETSKSISKHLDITLNNGRLTDTEITKIKAKKIIQELKFQRLYMNVPD